MREQSTAVRLPNTYRVYDHYVAIDIEHKKTGQRFEMLIDHDDLPRVLALPNRIYAYIQKTKTRDLVYARAHIDGKMIGIHRWLLDAPAGVGVDHWNHSGIDNRRANIRLATHAENMQNRRMGSYEDHRLLLQHRITGRWAIWMFLGEFPTQIEAEQMYDEAHALVTQGRLWDSHYALAAETDPDTGIRDSGAVYAWDDHAA